MTALCGGGTSSAKAGVSETIIFTAGALGSLLNNKGGWWATLAAPLLGVLAYSATDLCGTDPPAQPTITDEEYTALLQLGPWDTLQSALVKLKDIATRLIWFDMCECDSVTTPPLPVDTLTPPANVTIPTYGGGGTCAQPRARLSVPLSTATDVPAWTNVTRILFPGAPVFQCLAAAGYAAQDCVELPNHWVTLQGISDWVSGTTGASIGYATVVTGHNGARTPINQLSSTVPTSVAPHKENPTTPLTINHVNHKYISVNAFHTNTGSLDGVVDYAMNITCSGSPSSQPECCADPSVIALLSQLMQQVNLIQRQSVPFAYVPGTAHTGLTNTGELAVQGLIGALVDITAGAANVGTESGTPDQTFEAGWIAWGNSDGFIVREFVSNETLVSLPPLAGQFTRIGYTLPVDVTVTITELVREP